ncbi:transcriptional regulator, XRE family [Hydrogenobacter thermophilus TK-6]|nr:LexA family transcriptional regulator [Hydrogenobacter thermophilus]ADO45293.1 transcriptional regulator, XRE family [Hydrogenobacter thermophilus TK-6]
MKGLCNFADERSGGLLTVKDIIQIDRINAKFKCKPVEGKSSFSTGFFYNISYGLVNTHREYYTQLCTKVKGYGGISMQHCTSGEAGNIHNRLRYLRKTLGLSQEEFGERIGKSLRTIQYWEAGTVQIPDTALKLIASTFGVSYEWLKTGQGEMWGREKLSLEEIIEREQRKLLESKIKVPVVGKAGAGFPHSPSDIEVIGVVFVSKSPYLKEGKIFAVQVSGDSMHPALTEGDYVVFQTYEGDGSDIPNGKIVVVRNHSGELLVKRLLKMNGTVLLAGDNPKYPPIFPQQAEAEGLRIVGVAVKILKEFEA